MKPLLLETLAKNFADHCAKASPVVQEYGFDNTEAFFNDQPSQPLGWSLHWALWGDRRMEKVAETCGKECATLLAASSNRVLEFLKQEWEEGVINGFEYNIHCMALFAFSREENKVGS